MGQPGAPRRQPALLRPAPRCGGSALCRLGGQACLWFYFACCAALPDLSPVAVPRGGFLHVMGAAPIAKMMERFFFALGRKIVTCARNTDRQRHCGGQLPCLSPHPECSGKEQTDWRDGALTEGSLWVTAGAPGVVFFSSSSRKFCLVYLLCRAGASTLGSADTTIHARHSRRRAVCSAHGTCRLPVVRSRWPVWLVGSEKHV